MSKETNVPRERTKKASQEIDVVVKKTIDIDDSVIATSSTHHNQVHTENDGKCVDLANLTGYLYTTLESSLAFGQQAHQVKTLDFLAKSDLVDMEQVKRVVAQVASLCPEKSSSLLTALRNAQIRIQGAERHEVFLLQVLDFLWKGDLKEAHKRVNPDLKGLGAKTYTKEGTDRGSQACSGLLKFYGILLEHEARMRTESNAEEPLHIALGNLLEKHRSYLHLFAEPYVFFLVKDAKHAQAENFIKKCVEGEMADRCASRGISPLLAYELVHHYLPEAKQELKLYILESVAQVDPINPLVIELCHIYRDMASKKFLLTPSLRRCRLLELLMDFLDQQAPNPLPPACIEAWSMLSTVLSVICQKGSDEEVIKVLEIWHLNRQWYWPRRHFRIHRAQKYEDAALKDKALVCFLLSDSDDKEEFASFPKNDALTIENTQLDSIIKELNPSQQMLRSRFQQLLPEVRKAKYTNRLPESDTSTTPSVPSQSNTLSRVEKEDHPFQINLGCYGPESDSNRSKMGETGNLTRKSKLLGSDVREERTSKMRRTRKPKEKDSLEEVLESATKLSAQETGSGRSISFSRNDFYSPPHKKAPKVTTTLNDEMLSHSTDESSSSLVPDKEKRKVGASNGNGNGRKKRSTQTKMSFNQAPRPVVASRSGEDTSAKTDRKKHRRAASGATDQKIKDSPFKKKK